MTSDEEPSVAGSALASEVSEAEHARSQFVLARSEGGELTLSLSFEGDRFAPGRLPVSALPTLAAMEKLLNSVARDVDRELLDHVRASKYSKVDLVLTGAITEGSARLTALVLPAVAALSLAPQTNQTAVMDETVRRVPTIVSELASDSPLSVAVSEDTLRCVRDVSRDLLVGESLVLTVASPPVEGQTTSATAAGTATLTRALGTKLATQLSEVSEESFFVTGTLRNLEDRDADGSMTLTTGGGQFRVPASPERRQAAARMYSEARKVIFAVSGRAELDGGGRMHRVTHLSELTSVDRMLDLRGRLEELRALADDPEATVLNARIGRAQNAIPTVVHRTGLAPALFLTDEDEIEARWILGDIVVNATFGSDVEVYVFDRASEQIVHDAALPDDAEVLPGWAIADTIETHRPTSNG